MQDAVKSILNFHSEKFFVTSLYLRMTPQERSARPPAYRIRLKSMINQQHQWLGNQKLNPEVHRSLENDFNKLTQFVEEPSNLTGENSLPVRGIAIFSCSGEGLFQAVPLPYIERNSLIVDRTTYVRKLFAVEADFGENLVAVFDNRDARFFLVSIQGPQELVSFKFESDREMHSPGAHAIRTPSGFRGQHGVGERNVQMLKIHEQQQHLRHIAEKIRELRKTHPFDRLFIATSDEFANAFPSYLHDYVQRAYAGRINAHDKTPLNQLYESVLDRVHELDIEQEARFVQEMAANQPHLAVSGVEEVIKAVEWGNVRVLLYDSEFMVPGYKFYPSRHIGLRLEDAPEGTDEVWPLPDIIDSVLERALEQGALAEAVHSPAAREQIQGISALLRYAQNTPF